MTKAQKQEYRITTGYNNPWNPTTSITPYFTQLDRFQVLLGNRGIATSEEEKIMRAGVQMWNSKCSQKTRWLHGKTKRGARKMGSAPDVLQRQVAVTQTIFRDNSKTIALQRGSASSPRDSSSRGRRRVAGNVICDATGATRKTRTRPTWTR